MPGGLQAFTTQCRGEGLSPRHDEGRGRAELCGLAEGRAGGGLCGARAGVVLGRKSRSHQSRSRVPARGHVTASWRTCQADVGAIAQGLLRRDAAGAGAGNAALSVRLCAAWLSSPPAVPIGGPCSGRACCGF